MSFPAIIPMISPSPSSLTPPPTPHPHPHIHTQQLQTNKLPRNNNRLGAYASSDPAVQKPQASASSPGTGVTIEYQRQQAKAMQKYFKSLKEQEIVDNSKVFGWTKNNEINNGRWVMMGLAIGLLTEYATGVSFTDQMKLMFSYLGLVDLDY
jgi:hypothetical protein